MVRKFCPRVTGEKGSPTLKEIPCPKCGKNVEAFSNDKEVKCEECGALVTLKQI